MTRKHPQHKAIFAASCVVLCLSLEFSSSFVIDSDSSLRYTENPALSTRKRPIATIAENQLPSPSPLLPSYNQRSQLHPASPPVAGSSNGQYDTNQCKNGICTSTHLSSAATLELDSIDFLQHYQNFDTATSTSTSDYQIFCDLDGVLVDFEAGVQKILNQPTHELPKHIMWQGIEYADRFFERLPWTKGGRRLWQAIKHLSPDILTGVPAHFSSRIEKYNWCQRELGLEELNHVDMASLEEKSEKPVRNDGFDTVHEHCSVNGNFRKDGVCNVITCWSLNKHHESHSRAILIDDRISLKPTWEAAGGTFVHHTDTDSTLQQLRDLGVQLKDEDSLCLN